MERGTFGTSCSSRWIAIGVVLGLGVAGLAACSGPTRTEREPSDSKAEKPSTDTVEKSGSAKAPPSPVERAKASLATLDQWSSPTEAPFESEGHEEWLSTFANEIAERGRDGDAYAPGAMFAAHGRSDPSGPVERTYVMTKLEPGAAPELGDWHYALFDARGEVVVAGRADEPEIQERCSNCHHIAASTTDSVFGPPHGGQP